MTTMTSATTAGDAGAAGAPVVTSNAWAMKESSSGRPCWFSWAKELPLETDPVQHSAEFRFLHDDAFVREMAAEIRERVLVAARQRLPVTAGAAIVLAGGRSHEFELYDSDSDKTEFRQEAFFRYLFPINQPDCYGAIDLASGASMLFTPEMSEDSQRFNGEQRPLSWFVQTFGVTEAHIVDTLHETLQRKGIHTLYVLHGMNLDSGSYTRTPVEFAGIEAYKVDKTLLHPLLVEQRVFKTEREIQLMRVGSVISCQAHAYVMRHIKAGMTELQLEAMFKSWCQYYGGCRQMAYTCICGSGPNGSILHYGHAGRPNDRFLKEGDTVVLDMGAEYIGYATDITRSYPINGRFTPDQKIVHDAVYSAADAVTRAMKPGVSWPSLHRLSERVILEHLLRAGLVRNGTVDEMMEAHVASVFMPHGLGHLLGLNVHDVGGYLPGTDRDPSPGLRWLRCGRLLEAGMVITVEPGVYFSNPLIDKALADPKVAKFLDADVIARFRGTGGCRIEDDVLVTETGAENLTVLPSSSAEIEEFMKR